MTKSVSKKDCTKLLSFPESGRDDSYSFNIDVYVKHLQLIFLKEGSRPHFENPRDQQLSVLTILTEILLQKIVITKYCWKEQRRHDVVT